MAKNKAICAVNLKFENEEPAVAGNFARTRPPQQEWRRMKRNAFLKFLLVGVGTPRKPVPLNGRKGCWLGNNLENAR
jgi:hypothetical protein